MKSIGNIYLSWRPDAQSPRILVGIIKNNATSGVRFFYLADGAIEARRLGFEAYKGFPDVTEVYTKNVLRIFGHRVIRAALPDIEDFFKFWDINPEYKSKPFYMLAYTQGILDSDNFELLASFNPKPDFSLVTEVCELNEFSVAGLEEGDVLSYVAERDNAHDKDAIKLLNGDVVVGYVKVIHNRVFGKAKNLVVRVHKVEQNDKGDKVFIKISMP